MKNILSIPSLQRTLGALVLGLFLARGSAHAQSPWSLQADAGLSIASLQWSVLGMANDDLHRLNGLQGRLLAGYALTDNLSLQTGLGLVQLGASLKHEDHHDDFRINALEIPLLFRYSLPVGPGSLGLSAGPALAYHLSATSHTHEGETELEEELSIGNDVNDFARPFNLGLQTELSYTHQSGLLLNLRYNAGLMNLGTSDLVEMRTSYVAVGLGYRVF